jgi:hypothetical protein
MKPETIKKSFQATGVWPMDAEAVLKRFNNTTLEQDEAAELGQHGDGDSWIELRKLFEAAVPDELSIKLNVLSFHYTLYRRAKRAPSHRKRRPHASSYSQK